MNEIFFTVKSVYGKETIYPVCDQAKVFTALTGKKTVSLSDLKLIESLGFAICYNFGGQIYNVKVA